MKSLFAQTSPTAILHLAAESHIDRSITGSRSFIDTNIVGTYTMLETARRYWSGLSPTAKESSTFLNSKNPWAASWTPCEPLFRAVERFGTLNTEFRTPNSEP
jgi:UDP-glucose 4-epimerase